MDKYLEYLQIAEKKIRTIDHIIYVTFPLIKDKRLLLKVLSEMNLIVIGIINAVLQYESFHKNIELTKSPSSNLNLFFQKCSLKYEINAEEIRIINHIFDINQEYRKSTIEFMKNDKIVILSEDLTHSIITLEKIKQFLFVIKNILKKVQKIQMTATLKK